MQRIRGGLLIAGVVGVLIWAGGGAACSAGQTLAVRPALYHSSTRITATPVYHRHYGYYGDRPDAVYYRSPAWYGYGRYTLRSPLASPYGSSPYVYSMYRPFYTYPQGYYRYGYYAYPSYRLFAYPYSYSGFYTTGFHGRWYASPYFSAYYPAPVIAGPFVPGPYVYGGYYSYPMFGGYYGCGW